MAGKPRRRQAGVRLDPGSVITGLPLGPLLTLAGYLSLSAASITISDAVLLTLAAGPPAALLAIGIAAAALHRGAGRWLSMAFGMALGTARADRLRWRRDLGAGVAAVRSHPERCLAPPNHAGSPSAGESSSLARCGRIRSLRASNLITRRRLGWETTQPNLLADLDDGHYFEK